MKMLLFCALGLLSCPTLPAVQINLTYVTNGQVGSVPGTDPSGARLMAVAEAAAAHWEDIIEDNHTLNIRRIEGQAFHRSTSSTSPAVPPSRRPEG